MSTSKWVKLLAALVDNWFEIKECLVKPLWDEGNPARRLLLNEHTQYDFDYYATAMESMVSGTPRGWYAYKEIEWLDFPRLILTKEKAPPTTQNLETIKRVIDELGQ